MNLKIRTIDRLINGLFYTAFFALPLIIFPRTTEIFEFNKIVFTYLLTSLVASVWLIKIIVTKRINLKNTLLGFPVIIFVFTQFLSFWVTKDLEISLYGYYGRFNGGLISLVCYVILYFAYISNANSKNVIVSIKVLLASSVLVCVYAVLQRFGVDDHIWSQDVVYRVFSTLGQPNWLASWIAMLATLPLALIYKSRRSINFSTVSLLILVVIYFAVILLSKSRSGLIAMFVNLLIFYTFLLKSKTIKKPFIKGYLVALFVGVFATFTIIGTPWSPSLQEFINKPSVTNQLFDRRGTNTIETRKYVWEAAVNSWRDNLWLGSGPETFALSFATYKPIGHNSTIEWSHLFNKAHNEYLNYLSTTGLVGFLGYLLMILFSLLQFFKTNSVLTKAKLSGERFINFSITAGYVSLLFTNFFGFSTVSTNFLFFLFPALSFTLSQKEELNSSYKLNKSKVGGSVIILAFLILSLIKIADYWSADFYIAKAVRSQNKGDYKNSINYAERSLARFPNSQSLSNASMIYADYSMRNYFNNSGMSEDLLERSLYLAEKAIDKSPNNQMFRIDRANTYIKLSTFEKSYLVDSKEELLEIITKAPNDPKLWYNLGVIFAKLDDLDSARFAFQQSISLKQDYINPYHGVVLVCEKQNDMICVEKFGNYVVQNLDPNDQTIQSLLKRIN